MDCYFLTFLEFFINRRKFSRLIIFVSLLSPRAQLTGLSSMCVTSDVPSRPGRPHVTKVSEREVFLLWEEPETDGNSYIHAYKVDWLRPG